MRLDEIIYCEYIDRTTTEKKASETFQRVENNHKKGVKMAVAVGLAS